MGLNRNRFYWFEALAFGFFLVLLGAPVLAQQPSTAASPLKALTLSESLQIAAEHNPRIRQAQAQADDATGKKISARGRLLPRLDASADVVRTDASLINSFNSQRFIPRDNWHMELRLSQAVFAGGKNVATYNQQQALERVALYRLAATINNELFNVKQLFLRSLLAKEQLKVQRENIKLLEEELRLEKARFQAGTVSQFNVLRAEVALANARTPLIRAQNAVRLTLIDLERALGMLPEGSEASSDSEPHIEVAGTVVFEAFSNRQDESMARALQERPEIHAANLAVEAAKAGVTISMADFFPQLSVFGAVQNNRALFQEDFREGLSGWLTGAQLNWNLFEAGANYGRVESARAQKRDAESQRDDARMAVRQEVKRAIANIADTSSLLEASSKVVSQAKESLRLARARFDAGASSQIEVLDSQVALTQARTNEVQALYDYELARTEYWRAIGSQVQTTVE